MSKNKTKKKALRTIFLVFLALTIVSGASVAIVADHYMDKIHKIDDDDPVINPDDVNHEDDPEYDPEQENTNSGFKWGKIKPISTKKRVNILIVGQDTRTGARERSDVMCLASVNPSTGQVDLISFMRDTYVKLPRGYQPDKLNTPYCYSGFDLLSQTIYDNFGISIDGCFEIDFNGFQTIVNAIGGVDLYINDAEAACLTSHWGFTEFSGADVYHLDGERALQYSRIREIDNDFYRTDRQKNVITAILNKISGLGTSQLLSLVDSCLPYVRTNMSNTEIAATVTKCAPVLSNGMKITQCHAPDWGEFDEGFVNGMYVLFPHTTEINNRLTELIGD